MNEELKTLFIDKGIFNTKGKRKFCWKRYFDDECNTLFDDYAKDYRSKDEAWFCLSHSCEPQKCKICGGLAKFTGSTKYGGNGYNTVCENCSANTVPEKIEKLRNTYTLKTQEEKNNTFSKRKQTNLEKYGDENYTLIGSTSFRNNLKEKYGDAFYSNKEKREQTCLLKYGVTCNLAIPEIQQKLVETKREKYGNASNYEKTKQTNLKRYGVEHISQIKENSRKAWETRKKRILEISESNNCTEQSLLISKYGQGWLTGMNIPKLKFDSYTFIDNCYLDKIKKYASECNHTNAYTSKPENELFDYIKSISQYEVIKNCSNIISNRNHRMYELDIFIPELNIAFEFNGVYWHSTKFKDKYYHQRKLKYCYEQGVQLVHIYEHEWNTNKDYIKHNIKSLLNDKTSCINIGWIPVEKYNEYYLTEPNVIEIENCNFVIYDQGKFIKREN